MKPERPLPGCLGALLFALPTAPLTWLLAQNELFLGIAGLVGFLLAAAGYRLFAGRISLLGFFLAALWTLLAALPGLYWAYAELILRDNAVYGCTRAEALELVPSIALSPANRGQFFWDLGSLVLPVLLTAILTARYLSLRRMEKQA